MKFFSSTDLLISKLKRATLAIFLCMLSVCALVNLRGLINYLFIAAHQLQSKSAELIGGDFIAFFMGGSLYPLGWNVLYDFHLQKIWLESFSSNLEIFLPTLPFVNPPFIAALFSTLVPLGFQQAYFAWLCISCLYLAISYFALARFFQWTSKEIALSLLYCLAFAPLMVSSLPAGQLSCLGIAIASATALFALRGNIIFAGLCFACVLYKPQLFLLSWPLLLLIFRRRFLIGNLIGGFCIFLSQLSYLGLDGMLQVPQQLFAYFVGGANALQIEKPAYAIDGGLLHLLSVLFPSLSLLQNFVLYLIVVSLLLLWGIRKLAGRTFDASAVAFAMALGLSCSPLLNRYDLCLLLVPLGLSFTKIRSAAFALTALLIALPISPQTLSLLGIQHCWFFALSFLLTLVLGMQCQKRPSANLRNFELFAE